MRINFTGTDPGEVTVGNQVYGHRSDTVSVDQAGSLFGGDMNGVAPLKTKIGNLVDSQPSQTTINKRNDAPGIKSMETTNTQTSQSSSHQSTELGTKDRD